MSGIIKASECDWFAIVLDFVGFAPSRFYLRNTCKSLHETIPGEVYVPLGEFVASITEKLVNPKYLLIGSTSPRDLTPLENRPDRFSETDYRKILTLTVERILLKWDSEAIANSTTVDTLNDIEWFARRWGAFEILAKVMECKSLVPRHVGRPKKEVVDDLAICQRLIGGRSRPRNAGQWRSLLQWLAWKGLHKDAFEYVLRECGPLSMFPPTTIVHYIAGTNQVELMRNFLDSLSEDQTINQHHVKMALDFSLRFQRYEMTEFLMDRFDASNLIHWCYFFAESKIPPEISHIDSLVSRGVDINNSSPGGTCLDMALKHGYWELVHAIVQRGGKVYRLDTVFAGPVGRDISRFRIYLLQNGCLEGMKDVHLMRCAFESRNCCPEVLSEIIRHIVKRDASIVSEAFLLVMGCAEYPKFQDFLPLIKQLIELDPSLVRHSPDGVCLPMGACELYEPFRWERWSGKPDATWSSVNFSGHLLPQKDSTGKRNPELFDEWFDSDVDLDAVKAIAELKNVLIENGADPNLWFVPDSILGYLRKNPQATLAPAAQLLKTTAHGADINAFSRAETALSFSARQGHQENIDILMGSGALIFKPDGSIPSAFISAAAACGNLETVARLFELASVKGGFDINALDQHNRYQTGAIHESAKELDPEITRFLLERGADANLRSGTLGITPIMHACSSGRWGVADVARTLLDWKADVNARDANGQTAIFTCALVGSVERMEFLVANGADPAIPDNDGVRPIDLASFICRTSDALIGQFADELSICVRPIREDDDEVSRFIFPDSQFGILERLVEIHNEPEPRRLEISDVAFARKYRLDTIYRALTDR